MTTGELRESDPVIGRASSQCVRNNLLQLSRDGELTCDNSQKQLRYQVTRDIPYPLYTQVVRSPWNGPNAFDFNAVNSKVEQL